MIILFAQTESEIFSCNYHISKYALITVLEQRELPCLANKSCRVGRQQRVRFLTIS